MNVNYENTKTNIVIDLVYDISILGEDIFEWCVKLFFDTWDKFSPIIMSEKFIPYFGITLFSGTEVRELHFRGEKFIQEVEYVKNYFDYKHYDDISINRDNNKGEKYVIKTMSASLNKLREATEILNEEKTKTVMVLISDAWNILKNNSDSLSFVPDFSFFLLHELSKKAFFDSTREWDILIQEKKDSSVFSKMTGIKRCYWLNHQILNDNNTYVNFYENHFYLPLYDIITN